MTSSIIQRTHNPELANDYEKHHINTNLVHSRMFSSTENHKNHYWSSAVYFPKTVSDVYNGPRRSLLSPVLFYLNHLQIDQVAGPRPARWLGIGQNSPLSTYCLQSCCPSTMMWGQIAMAQPPVQWCYLGKFSEFKVKSSDFCVLT